MAQQLTIDYRVAELSPQDRALCDYAVKLTLAPDRMGEHDVATLCGHGFEDSAITVAAQVIGYFNYINRIANGLGVDLEAWMTVPPEDWERQRGRDYLSTLPTQ